MSILSGVIASYRFEEAATLSASEVGGSGFDQLWSYSAFVPCDVQSGPSTGWGSPVRGAGVVGYGLDLNSAWTEARTPAGFAPTAELTWTAKVFTSLVGATADPIITLFGQNGSNPAEPIYSLRVYDEGGTCHFRWDVSGASTASYTVVSGSLSVDAWYTVEVWIDIANQLIGIKVDCGSAVTLAFPEAVPVVYDTYCFHFGRDGQSFAYSGVRLDAATLWNRRLTSDEEAIVCGDYQYPYGEGGGGGAEVACSSSLGPQMWMMTTDRNVGRWQAAATRDMEVNSDETSGSAVPAWEYSTGFDLTPVPTKIEHLYIQVETGELELNVHRTTDDNVGRRKVYRHGEHEFGGLADYAGYRFRLRMRGFGRAILNRILWERSKTDGRAP